VIRTAERAEAAAIRKVLLSAFPTSAEADLVERLRANHDTIISLVSERLGEIVGHIVLSRMAVSGNGREYRALGLGPVAVSPPFQRTGTGSELIRAAVAAAKAMGEELIFVVGAPAYYRRFGFETETAAPFASVYSGPSLMALRLAAVDLPPSGIAAYARPFAEMASE
jgi:putative acetyltransferase